MSTKDWAEKDYYKILGVSKDAKPEEIKKRLMITAATLKSLRAKTKFASQVDVKSSRLMTDRGDGLAGALETNLNPMLDKLFVSDWN